MTINDQYLFVTNYSRITIRDLQSNKLINTIPTDEGFFEEVLGLSIVDNKIISVDYNFTLRIWNLDRRILHLNYYSSIEADSKKNGCFYFRR